MDNDQGFPIYRRSHGGMHLFRIDAADRFQELQRIGRRWTLHTVLASAYPEKVRIQDMVACAWHFEPSDVSEWSAGMEALGVGRS